MIIWNIATLFAQPIFWIVIGIIWFQFRRMAKMKSKLFNVPEESVLKPTIIATLYGLVGGVIGSLILIVVGISVLEIGIQYLWLLAIAMMLINQRFMCFAYAGGIVSLLKYFFGVPAISIPQVMGLVAVLHLVEAILILFSGHLGAVPVYVKDRQGRLVGGFNLQKFWPLPIVAMVAMAIPQSTPVVDIMQMPEWWPLIKSELLVGEENIIYMMLPVIAGLGYGDIALTAKPKEKTSYSAFNLGIFSIILLGLAILAAYFPALSILAALFSPLGHELIIYLGRRAEFNGEPKFINPQQGIMILDLLPDSPLKRAGLDSGDIIISINGSLIDNSWDLRYILQFTGKFFEIEYLEDKRKVIKRKLVVKENIGEALGLILVPDGYVQSYLDFSQELGFTKKILNKLFRKRA